MFDLGFLGSRVAGNMSMNPREPRKPRSNMTPLGDYQSKRSLKHLAWTSGLADWSSSTVGSHIHTRNRLVHDKSFVFSPALIQSKQEKLEALGMDEGWTEYKALVMDKPVPGVYVTPHGRRRPVGHIHTRNRLVHDKSFVFSPALIHAKCFKLLLL
jgi:hypothetical protein